jgi:hypothetical protein
LAGFFIVPRHDLARSIDAAIPWCDLDLGHDHSNMRACRVPLRKLTQALPISPLAHLTFLADDCRVISTRPSAAKVASVFSQSGMPMHALSHKTNPAFTATAGRALPYLLSWGVLAGLMIVGMDRVPSALYRPVDGDWAKWNVEAILHFGRLFDLSPYSMLAGMGSMYFPNLPWLNPGALALAAARRPGEEYCLLRRIRGRTGHQHRCAGARDRVFLADGDGRGTALPLSVVSALLRSLPHL